MRVVGRKQDVKPHVRIQARELSSSTNEKEAERLAALTELRVSDSGTSGLLEGFPELAAAAAQCPIAWLSFATSDHEFVSSAVGTAGAVIALDGSQIEDLLTSAAPIAVQNPTKALPVEGGSEFAYYAGFPLITSSGQVIGSIAVADVVNRTLSLSQQAALTSLARRIIQALELNRSVYEARAELEARRTEQEQLEQAVDKLHDVTIAKDVREAELVERNIELQSMAETDGLTGLRNYRSLNQHLRGLFASGAPVGILLVDVDWFKNFNDAFGHVAGDETLRVVGGLMAQEARGGALAFRYGGEEFAIVVPSGDAKVVLQAGEQLRQRVERHPWPSRPITVCVGAAVRTPDIATVEELTKRADDALYAAKRTGKNRVLLWANR
ncbi:MAG TPA: diguanylate cyclase [Fimbriimonadaceae bacterium]|nr:diguanylate cyclase [Fimbriimonadaceae bacterium]